MKYKRLLLVMLICVLGSIACKTRQTPSTVVGKWVSIMRTTEWGRIQDSLVLKGDGRFEYESHFLDGNSRINSLGNYSLDLTSQSIALKFDDTRIDSIEGRFGGGLRILTISVDTEEYIYNRVEED